MECAGFFGRVDFIGRDVEVALVVERVDDRGQHDAGERHAREQPHVPDQGEAEHQREGRYHGTRTGVGRHVDWLEAGQGARVAMLLHVPPGIDLVHAGREGEVVLGRGRGGGPFQRAGIPRVAREVAQLVALEVAHHELHQEAADAQGDEARAGGGDHEPDLQGRILEVVDAARHAHQAQDVQGRERHPEAHHPQPEGAQAPGAVELVAEGLGEPVVDAGEQAEQHAADDHVVEVGDQEQAVVQHEVGRGHGQQHAGHAADGESGHERHGPHHGQLEADAALVHGEQPVEDLRARGDRDDHRRDAEERVHAGAGAHREEVVQPHQVRQDGDHHRGIDHGGVAEQALAAERGDHFGEDAEGGQHQDVHLGVAPDPDQVHVQHRVAAEVVREEVRADVAVQRHQHQGGRQHREGGHDQGVGAQGRPGEDGHLHQVHAGCAHLDDRDDQVDARERGAHPRDLQRPYVVVEPGPRVLRPQVGEGQPAGGGELAQEQRDHHQDGTGGGHPEAEVVQEREGHVARADLQRHDVVHQAGDQRHRHEEDHDHAMGGEDLVVVVRRQVAHVVAEGDGLLQAHHHRVGEAAQQHHDAQDHVHDPDLLVVDAADPVAPQRAPQAEARDRGEDGEAAQHHGDEGPQHDGFVRHRHGVPVEPSQGPVGRGNLFGGHIGFLLVGAGAACASTALQDHCGVVAVAVSRVVSREAITRAEFSAVHTSWGRFRPAALR